MSKPALKKWADFWASQKTPSHRADSPTFLRRHARELRNLFEDDNPKSILELGCGDGALFSLLGFEHLDYKGGFF